MRPPLAGVLAVTIAMTIAQPSGQSAAPISYTLRFPALASHYADIEAVVPTGGRPEVMLRMAVWTPGSYLVREYARHVEAVQARTGDGTPCEVTKTEKNTWAVDTHGAAEIHVSYRVYGREMSVRTNYFDPEFALINGAATYLTLADDARRPHEVRLELPPGWRAETTLEPLAEPGRFRAPDYDTLVDSPIVAGTPAIYGFTAGGVQHQLVNIGEGGIWDGPRSAQDLQRIAEAETRFWGVVPYSRYIFFNVITADSGGLEHKNCAVLMVTRWRSRTRKGYLGWASTATHELFHAWNGKRLRPIELGPFDYARENYTRSLWIVEGFTEYYAKLLMRRAGITSDREHLDMLSDIIERMQTRPGRLVQTAEASSFDAWIKTYRPDENSENTSIDYYGTGAVIAFLLDAEVRRATGGGRSLDDVMRLAYQRFSGDKGYTTDEFIRTVGEVAGRDLSAWIARASRTTDALDYQPALDWFGLRFRAGGRPDDDKAWLGARLRNDSGRLVVTEVPRGTPAEAAGVSVDDEILAVDEYRVRADGWEQRMESYRPGDTVTLLVARRERLLRVPVTLASEPPKAWRLEPAPGATREQQQHLRAWLEGLR